MTAPLTSHSRQSLRARAHRLHPIVSVSQKGLIPTVMAEIEAALRAHELIKIRIYGAERAERSELLAEICVQTQAEPVQQIGNILIIYREKPKPVVTPNKPNRQGKTQRTPASRTRTPQRDFRTPSTRSRGPRSRS